MNAQNSLFMTLAISVVCLVADYLLKVASESPQPFRTPHFVLGAAIFAGVSFFWVLVLRHLKLATVGVAYGVSTVVLMALLGFAVFGETLRWSEWIGIVLGIASIVLLGRFAEGMIEQTQQAHLPLGRRLVLRGCSLS